MESNSKKNIRYRIEELIAYKELSSENFGFCHLSEEDIQEIKRLNYPEYQKELDVLEGKLISEQLE